MWSGWFRANGMNPRQRKSDPFSRELVLWVISVALFLMTLAGAYWFHDAVSFNTSRIEQAKPEGMKRIVALGSSLFFAGFPKETTTPEVGEDIEIIRMIQPGATIDSFYAVVDKVLRNKPDLLVIEANMLAYDFEKPPVFLNRLAGFRFLDQITFKARRTLVQAEKTILKPPQDGLEFGELGSLMFPENYFADWIDNTSGSMLSPEYLKEKYGNALRVKDDTACFTWKHILKEARKRDVPIVLLEMPRAPVVESYIPEQTRAELERETDKLSSVEGVRYVRFDREIGTGDFMDTAHLNLRGRAIFLQWFSERVHGWTGGDAK